MGVDDMLLDRGADSTSRVRKAGWVAGVQIPLASHTVPETPQSSTHEFHRTSYGGLICPWCTMS